MLVDFDIRRKHGMVFLMDSFWRHPFTAYDSLVSKWCNNNLLQIFSDDKLSSSTVHLGWPQGEFEAFIFLFWGKQFL